MRELPHYLRFARSLALVGGLAACGDSTTTGDTAGADTASDATTADTSSADATAPADTVADAIEDTAIDCATCVCGDPDTSEACIQVCCIAVGPLAPPDLPA